MKVQNIRKVSQLNKDLLRGVSLGGAIIFEGKVLQKNKRLREMVKLCLKRDTEQVFPGDAFAEMDMGVIRVDELVFVWRIRYFNNKMTGYSKKPWLMQKTRRLVHVLQL